MTSPVAGLNDASAGGPSSFGWAFVFAFAVWAMRDSSQDRRAAIFPAARWAMPYTVSIGLTPDAVGNAEASVTNRSRTWCDSLSGPMADRDGSVPIRQLPIW